MALSLYRRKKQFFADMIFHNKTIYKIPASVLFYFLISSFILIAAYIVEFGFDIIPYKLCIYQRYVYFAIVILSLAVVPLFYFSDQKSALKFEKIVLFLFSTFLIIGIVISFYQFGIEKGWFGPYFACQDIPSHTLSFDQFKKSTLTTKPQPACDETKAVFLGISLATYNMISSLILAVIAIYNFTFIMKK